MTEYIWHPFRYQDNSLPLLNIVKGKGTVLYADNGQEYLDLVSSWWVNTHGHAHPKIAQAIADQAHTLEHTLFADTIHPAASKLSLELIKVLPRILDRFFFSDNGSTAVEVALKIAYQYWFNKGQEHRKRFLAFDGGYHGDTFGAMAAGQSSGFYKPFEKFLFQVDTIPYPETWMNDLDIEQKEENCLNHLKNYLEEFAFETSAIILEPLIQGAAGMRFSRPEFLQKVVSLIRSYNILIIFDEVMTGFGRTGSLFACQKAEVIPDIICLAKGLTGGFLPMALTITNSKIFQEFFDKPFDKSFLHGHSFAANPLGCAAALANLEVFETEDTLENIQTIEEIHLKYLDDFQKHSLIEKCRVMGSIAAFNVKDPYKGKEPIGKKLKEEYFKRGLFLRPLNNVIYLLPPYCISSSQLEKAYEGILSSLESL